MLSAINPKRLTERPTTECPMATMCPTFKTAVQAVMQKHTAYNHAFSGGKGVSCFVWVVGPGITPKGNPSKKLVKAVFGSNCLDLTGTLADDLKQIPGYVQHWINID